MRLCLCGGIQAVDVGAAGVIKEVLFGGADEVSQLIVARTVSAILLSEVQGTSAHAMGILRGK